jgi:hypothetical protein
MEILKIIGDILEHNILSVIALFVSALSLIYTIKSKRFDRKLQAAQYRTGLLLNVVEGKVKLGQLLNVLDTSTINFTSLPKNKRDDIETMQNYIRTLIELFEVMHLSTGQKLIIENA